MKRIRAIVLLALIAFFSMVGHQVSHAASTADNLVTAAVNASKALYNLTTVENKGTGTNVPTKEYNTALQKYKLALTAVNKQTGKQKTTNLTKLKDVKTKIDRGKKYIDAVNDGKKLLAKKATVDQYVKKGVMDTNTVNAYNSLSSTLKSYTPKITALYGKKTQDKLKALYKTPVDKVLSDLQYPVTVKKAINDTTALIKASATSSKLTGSYKSIVVNLDLIKQANYQKQLAVEVKKLSDSVPVKLRTGSFGELLTIEAQFEQLDSLVSKGKSDQKVPGLNGTLKTNISKYSVKGDQTLLTNR